MAFGKAGEPPNEPLGRNPDYALDRDHFLIGLVGHDPTLGGPVAEKSWGLEDGQTRELATSKMSAGRTSPALAGSGVGCGLAGPHAARCYTCRMAASWPSPHMSQSHSFFGPPPSRVHQRYVASPSWSTQFCVISVA